MVKNLLIETHIKWQLKSDLICPLFDLTHLVVNGGQLGANWVPIGCQLGANRTPIGIRFLELTMEILPVAISLHRHLAREYYHRQFYSKHQALFDCNGEFSLKKCGERDNTI